MHLHILLQGATGGSAGASVSTTTGGITATAVAAAGAAEDTSLTTPLANMNPPLLPGLAKARIQNLHNAAFAKAKRIVPSSLFRSRIVTSPSSQQTTNGNSSAAAAAAGGGGAGGSTTHNGSIGDATTVVEVVPGDSSATSRSARPAVPNAAVMLKADAPGTDRAALQGVVDGHHERVVPAAKAAAPAGAPAAAGGAGTATPTAPAPVPTSAEQNGAGGNKKRPAEAALAGTATATVCGSGVEILDLSHLPDSPRPGGVQGDEAFRVGGALESNPAKKLKVHK